MEIVVFASGPVGKAFLSRVIPFLADESIIIRHVVVCNTIANPFYIANQDDCVIQYCKENGIDVLLSPEELVGSYDIGFSLSNFFILKNRHIRLFKHGIINFHGAPILWYRGSAAPSFHILGQDTHQWGFTFHLLNEDIDSGDIIEQRLYDIRPNLSAVEIDATVIEEALDYFPVFFNKIINAEYQLTPQKIHDGKVNRRSELYGGEITGFEINNELLHKLIRAYDWPKILEHAQILVGGKPVRLVPENTYQIMLKNYRNSI